MARAQRRRLLQDRARAAERSSVWQGNFAPLPGGAAGGRAVSSRPRSGRGQSDVSRRVRGARLRAAAARSIDGGQVDDNLPGRLEPDLPFDWAGSNLGGNRFKGFCRGFPRSIRTPPISGRPRRCGKLQTSSRGERCCRRRCAGWWAEPISRRGAGADRVSSCGGRRTRNWRRARTPILAKVGPHDAELLAALRGV